MLGLQWSSVPTTGAWPTCIIKRGSLFWTTEAPPHIGASLQNAVWPRKLPERRPSLRSAVLDPEGGIVLLDFMAAFPSTVMEHLSLPEEIINDTNSLIAGQKCGSF